MLENLKIALKDNKEKLNYKILMNLYESIVLIVLSIIALIFDRKIGTISVLYLLPIYFIATSFEYLLVANKYKSLPKITFFIDLFNSLILLIIPIYLVFHKINTKGAFISLIGLIIILKNIIDFLGTPDKNKYEYIKNISMVIIGLLIIVLSETIKSYYFILLIFIIIIGIVKFIFSNSLKK